MANFMTFLYLLLTLLPNFLLGSFFGKELGPFCIVDWSLTGKTEDEIVFDLCCKVTKGWIGFGISKNGLMHGSDIVTFKWLGNGSLIFEDRHGVGNKKPVIDVLKDYKLLSSVRNGSHTTLKFSRLLNTCDKLEDVEITGDTMKLIWALGELSPIEKLEQHSSENRGSIVVNLLEKRLQQPLNRSTFTRFDQNIVLNGNSTIYACKIHKSPFKEKHHVIGFDVFFGSVTSRKYAHHASLLSCTPPPGSSPEQFFSQYVDQEYDCYYTDKYFPTEHCKYFEFQWTYGGMPSTFPEDLGIPIGEQSEQFFMSMIHVDNPMKEKGIVFRFGFDLFYTKQLRKVDIGFLQLGINSSRGYSLTVPPNATNFLSSSHCPGECTKRLPPTGINVFMYLFHFHLSGRKMRIRQFRESAELPWIAKDDNYDTNYQINRMMRKPVNVMPNDHLTVECEFETKWLNGSTVIGGRGIEAEMCQAFVMYYPRTKALNRCGSFVEQEQLLKFMGIENVEIEKGGNDPMVLSPSFMAGKRYTQVVTGIVNWSPERRAKFQNMTRFGPQVAVCRGDTKDQQINVITHYPSVKKDYVPLAKCTGKGGHSGSGKSVAHIPSVLVSFCFAVFAFYRI